MKKALVLGASGGMGQAIVNELVNRKIEVVVFARNKAKLNTLYGDIDLVSIVSGDALNKDDLDKAMTDVDTIFHALNIPYSQ
ncbi:hypothetical protein JCM21714_4194 [Gracilibacillus boraciitolerans JCM 21714]|uniref:NAD(P)-binding domain-containing protein n=1 Tax=Gracilibacillus boraciitolerans JCM 21714 TaxID=1298598 RepID=W4VPA6_9BACI|nr:hypothetical protein JCM21714_4194 [Gracilibacillus boraciitolerans JCM 21714]